MATYKKGSLSSYWIIKRYLIGYGFLLPALLIYILFVLKPLLFTFYLSFVKWDGVAAVKKFVGWGNYSKVLASDVFWEALYHNVVWTGLMLAVPLLLGLILAVILDRSKIKAKQFFMAAFFAPGVLGLIMVGIIWGWIYNPQFGVLNTVLNLLGLNHLTRGWLGDPKWALVCIIGAGAWTYYGFCMVIYYAALQGVDQNLYEAAKIDGATELQCFIYITIPSLRTITTFLILISLINSFKVFDIVYTMTRGGPSTSSEVLATYSFVKAFEENQVGYGSAVCSILTIIILLSTYVFLVYRERSS